MSLANLSDLLREAQAGGYAVGAFNVFNLETAQAVVAAAEAEHSPVILLMYDSHLDHFGVDEAAALGRMLADKAQVPVAVHLDHGASFARVVRCIRAGYTSVMYDGSRLPFDENVAATRRIVEIAHHVDVSVEGEIGHVGRAAEGEERIEEWLTRPREAADFVEATGVDCLAVAIGNAHGFYREEPKLDFARLEAINRLVDVPLVLHGSSGIPEADLRRAIELGIRKVNVGTETLTAFGAALRDSLAQTSGPIRGLGQLSDARAVMQGRVQSYMQIFGSSGKA